MDVLKTLYAQTSSLSEYLQTIGFQNIIQSKDKAGFCSYIQTTIIADTTGNLQLEGPVNIKHCSRQDEVVIKAVQLLKTRDVAKSKNVLLFGKAQTKVGGTIDSNNQTLLMLPNWEILLSRVGDEVMLHLLVNMSVFLFAPPSCYIQVCGVPIYDLISSPIKKSQPDGIGSQSDLACRVFAMASVCHRKKGCSTLPKTHPLECLPASNTGARTLMTSIVTVEAPKKLTKLGKSKIHRTPRRFIQMQSLVKDILTAHKKTNITALLEGHCPILGSGVNRQMSPPTLQALLNNTMEPWRVFLFLRGVLLRAVPFPVWGSMHNRQAFLKFVEKFTKLGRSERLELEQLVKKMRMGDCEWTQLKKLRGRSPCRSDVLMQQRMVSNLVSWIMSDYVMVLIKSAFYITESSSSRNSVVYYRKATWNMLEKIGLEQCRASGNLKPISDKLAASFITSDVSFGYSSLRFVPKENGLRPITNMKQVATEKQAFSINTLLEDVYDILRYHRTKEPSHFGSSILSVNEAYQKWKQFVVKTRTKDARSLYFVKVDITQCYDSIPHLALYNVIERLLQLQAKNQQFTIFRYVTVSRGGATHKKYFRRHTHLAQGNHTTFHQMMLQLALEDKLKDAVLVNRVSSHSTSAKSVMALLKKHVGCDIVKFCGKHFLRQKGIPQGSIISSWLCNYFYAAMETSCLPHLTKDELMVRLLDDFLLVTPYLQNAECFLKVLLDGLPQYGCHANPTKTLTNFPFVYNGRPVQSSAPSELFPWCGLLFNTCTLEVSNDYTRYKDVSIRYTLAMDSTGDAINKVQAKLLQALQTKCTGFFLDLEINFLPTIRRNCYEMFLMSAFRFHSQLRILPHQCKTVGNISRKLLSIIFKLTEKLQRVGSPLNKSETKWLCLKAFQTKLELHHSSYRRPLKLIRKTKRKVSRHMGQVEMEALETASTPAMPQAFKDMRT